MTLASGASFDVKYCLYLILSYHVDSIYSYKISCKQLSDKRSATLPHHDQVLLFYRSEVGEFVKYLSLLSKIVYLIQWAYSEPRSRSLILIRMHTPVGSPYSTRVWWEFELQYLEWWTSLINRYMSPFWAELYSTTLVLIHDLKPIAALISIRADLRRQTSYLTSLFGWKWGDDNIGQPLLTEIVSQSNNGSIWVQLSLAISRHLYSLPVPVRRVLRRSLSL